MTKETWGPRRIWRGGGCPVHGDTKIDGRFRDESSVRGPAWKFYWDHSQLSTGADLTSYRVRLDTAKPIGKLVVGETYRERSGVNLWTIKKVNHSAWSSVDDVWKAVDQDGNDGCGWDKTGEFVDEDAPGCDLIERITDANREDHIPDAGTKVDSEADLAPADGESEGFAVQVRLAQHIPLTAKTLQSAKAQATAAMWDHGFDLGMIAEMRLCVIDRKGRVVASRTFNGRWKDVGGAP